MCLMINPTIRQENGNTQLVMDGGLTPFIKAFLLSTIGTKNKA